MGKTKKPAPTAPWMSRAELQRVLGRSRAAIDGLLAAGLPHETAGVGRGAEIRIPRNAAMAWLAARAQDRPPHGPTRPPVPECARIFEQVTDPVHVGMVVVALETVYSVTHFARFMALQAGCPEEQAGRIAGTTLMLAYHLEGVLRRVGVEAFQAEDPEWLQAENFWWAPSRGHREDLVFRDPA